MKGVFSVVGFLAAIIALVLAGYQYGFSSDKFEDELDKLKLEQNARQREHQMQIDNLTQQLQTVNQKVEAASLTANRAEIWAEGLKSQTDKLGSELNVDVESAFQTTVADAEKQRNLSVVKNPASSAPEALLGETPAPPISMRDNQYFLESKGCERFGQGLNCTVLIVNEKDELRKVHIDASDFTLFDDNDDGYQGYKVRFQGREHWQLGSEVSGRGRSNMILKINKFPQKRVPKRIQVVVRDTDIQSDMKDELRMWLKN